MKSPISTWMVLGAATAAAFSSLFFLLSSTPQPRPPPSMAYDAFFSDNYYEARALFRETAAMANATLHTIRFPVNEKTLDLSIDIAVLRGAKPDSLVVHLSGTHGVEGFAGSAIQSAVLANWTTTPHDATVVFVHAVNPYGFATLRRVNEHNVDLNRNHLTTEAFAARRAMDPNFLGYDDLTSFLNPSATPTLLESARGILHALVMVATRGFLAVRRAIATGTYHHADGIFYGGQQLEASHTRLHAFFAAQFDLASFAQVVLVDVHTGLGAPGVDTLNIFSNAAVGVDATPARVAAAIGIDDAVVSLDDAGDDSALAGYEHAGGFAMDGYSATWFPATTAVVGVTQEFGTVSPLAVIDALRRENAATQARAPHRLAAAEALRDVFYLHHDPMWKFDVGSRGRALLETVMRHVDGVPHA
ncbi:Aste57867_6950 [Aphanomyces stellatus]|uniref:Aste57867_6950 protein n=1 Tax=Aphanomyces stellatus TaxID=120398 RepID=A0A485KG64_9STRA|nr:hypothetical protein As57867_006928 [Aphanomyces stellatus]VFT83902.1 Aste57867_6950 [Aphanomyces stellatus]